MIAKISFTVYQDYDKYLKEEDDYEYDEALAELNKHIKELVDKNELTFTYDGKKVHPILPLTLSDVGNIFDEYDYDGPNWDGVDIACEIDIDPSEFNASKFKVNKYPYYFDPRCIVH